MTIHCTPKKKKGREVRPETEGKKNVTTFAKEQGGRKKGT